MYIKYTKIDENRLIFEEPQGFCLLIYHFCGSKRSKNRTQVNEAMGEVLPVTINLVVGFR